MDYSQFGVRRSEFGVSNSSSRLSNYELRTLNSELILPLAKYCRADAHHRRAFFNRDFVIVGHAHRQLATSIAECTLRAQLVAQFAQPAKVWTDLLSFIKEGRQ